jgi:small subunit ribosomal protein S1
VHISELANHHVENPREVVQPGDDVKVKILEIETERRRLSLSVKRVEGQILPRRSEGPQAVPEGPGDLDDVPELGLSEDVFSGAPTPQPDPEAAGQPAAADSEPEAPRAGAVADDAQLDAAAAEAAAESAAAEAPPAAGESAPAEPASEPQASAAAEPDASAAGAVADDAQLDAAAAEAAAPAEPEPEVPAEAEPQTAEAEAAEPEAAAQPAAARDDEA